MSVPGQIEGVQPAGRLYPRLRTRPYTAQADALCQQQTSVNNFGAHEERRRDRDAKRFGRLHVDDEVEAGGTLKR